VYVPDQMCPAPSIHPLDCSSETLLGAMELPVIGNPTMGKIMRGS
jgi:hypothetical protein